MREAKPKLVSILDTTEEKLMSMELRVVKFRQNSTLEFEDIGKECVLMVGYDYHETSIVHAGAGR